MRLGRHKNRFDVQVVFPDLAFGIKNRTDVEMTPEIVATALEAFCVRIREMLGRSPSLDAVDPHAATDVRLSPRD